MKLRMAIYPLLWMLTIVSLLLRVVAMLALICGLSLVMLIAALKERVQEVWLNGKV